MKFNVTKTELFILKRVIITFIILVLADLVFLKANISVIKGLFIGELLGLLKFGLMSKWLNNLLNSQGSKGIKILFIVQYLLSQAAVIVILALILKSDMIMFGGLLCGILTIPVLITLNAITEALNITHNNFE